MSKLSSLVTGVAVAAALTGCGGSTPAPAAAPAPEKEMTATVVEAPAVDEAMPVEEAPATEAAAAEAAPAESAPASEVVAPPAAADANHEKLIGTKWKLGDFDVHFKDAETVHLNGGPLTMMTAGKGLDAKYAYTDGKLRVNAMGQSKEGTWDGEALTVDGEVGVKAE